MLKGDDDSGEAQSDRSPRHAKRRHQHPRAKRSHQARAHHAKHTRQPHAHAPTVAATHRAPLPGPNVVAWHAAGHAASNPASLLELAAGQGLGDVILELVGAEAGNLRATLAAWQREQDRVANRAWRRPGGLARPAGL